ncbi:hypothetical protein FAIPA1_130120 [Frankia sp. AiPs1]
MPAGAPGTPTPTDEPRPTDTLTTDAAPTDAHDDDTDDHDTFKSANIPERVRTSRTAMLGLVDQHHPARPEPPRRTGPPRRARPTLPD